jgi:hypothetical protein
MLYDNSPTSTAVYGKRMRGRSGELFDGFYGVATLPVLIGYKHKCWVHVVNTRSQLRPRVLQNQDGFTSSYAPGCANSKYAYFPVRHLWLVHQIYLSSSFGIMGIVSVIPKLLLLVFHKLESNQEASVDIMGVDFN